jgi:hypothetical protein
LQAALDSRIFATTKKKSAKFCFFFLRKQMGLYVSKSSGDGVGGGRRSRMRRGGGENVKIHICSFASCS